MAERKLDAGRIVGLLLLETLLASLARLDPGFSDGDSLLLFAALYRAYGDVGFGEEFIFCSYKE